MHKVFAKSWISLIAPVLSAKITLGPSKILGTELVVHILLPYMPRFLILMGSMLLGPSTEAQRDPRTGIKAKTQPGTKRSC